MTSTAVNYLNNKEKLEVEKEIAALDRKINFEKLGISKDELMEKIRHNQVDEYLQEKKVNADDRNGFMSGLGAILKGVGIGGAISGLAAAVNDESYHNKLIVAYDQATNLPFNEKAGNPNYWNKAGLLKLKEHIDQLDNYQNNTPNSGIIHVRYIPTIAVEDQEIQSSELQNNVRMLFTKVRSANSGAVNQYDQSDLFQFTLASSSVFEMLRLVTRPLNYLAAKRKESNVFTAWDETMLKIMTGTSANARNIINKRTEYIQAINSCIRSNNSQALPIGFDLTKRRSLLNGRIFTHKGDRDEIYLFTPTCYYVYDEANGKLTSKQLDINSLFSSPEDVAAVLREMLQPLVNGTVTSIMAGDMKKAYQRQVSIIRELPYNLKGDIYSEDDNVLDSLRNANIMNNIPEYGAMLDIKQGITDSLDTFIYQGTLRTISGKQKAQIYGDPHRYMTTDAYDNIDPEELDGKDVVFENLLDVKSDKPSKYDIMSGTRFKTSFYVKFVDNTIDPDDPYLSATTYMYQWGTEVITRVNVWYFNTDIQFDGNAPMQYGYASSDLPDSIRTIDYAIQYLSLATRYHYLPMVLKYVSFDEVGKYFFQLDVTHGRYNDLLLTDTQLLHLHNASFGSLISIKEESTTEIE